MERALTHLSAAGEHKASYQRLEFLGDALLDFIVAEELFRSYPDSSEGELTEMRRVLVNSDALSKLARTLGLDRFVIADGSQQNAVTSSVLADVFEALVGAIYIDGGLKRAREFVKGTLLSHADVFLGSPHFVNYKGGLLELLQSRGKKPRYKLLGHDGPPHRRIFRVGVFVDGELFGIGAGRTKKEAEQVAAREALRKLGGGT